MNGCSQRISKRNQIFRLPLDADPVDFIYKLFTDLNKEGQESHDQNYVLLCQKCVFVMNVWVFFFFGVSLSHL